MSSKLKRKLDNLGVDIHSNSSKLTENFCLVGTPLPPLEKAKDTGEFVPLWKQEVRDEQGRRRLHGAFTGGFSAGYYNTVGSKEGWVPSTFTSSRSERASKKQARPEDFMDEEDLAAVQESKKLVDINEETDLFGGTQAELAKRNGSGVEKDTVAHALETLFPPSKDSVGARLLKKMGWRPGQGVGPRVTYKQLRIQEGRPIGKDEFVDEEANKHMYAPRDTKTVVFQKKENAFGLGYAAGQGLNDIVQGRNGQVAGSGPNLSAGFGLGALNDAEDDDVDVYDPGYPREDRGTAYAGETEDDDRITLKSKKVVGVYNVSGKSNNTGPSVSFRDGRPIVSGFVLSDKPLIEGRWFPIPDIPEGWAPDPRRVWAKDSSREQGDNAKAPLPSTSQGPSARVKTSDERGSMLGEVPLPSAPRSVFDYLSQKDRDRLKNLSSGLASGSATIQPPPPAHVPISVPRTDPGTAQAALKGFQPFTSDPGKQLRYTVYLQSQISSSDAPEITPLPGQSNDEFNKEVSDYAKAAQIFKPVSGAMAGRFASASVVEVMGSTHEGLHKPSKDEYARLENRPEEGKKDAEESPKAHAAKMGMFGPMTREVKVWQPARLLCKRFGVKDPHPDGVGPGEAAVPGRAASKSEAWQAEVVKTGLVPNFTTASTSSAATPDSSTLAPSSRSTGQRNLANIGLGDDEDQGKETLTYERPAKDIFKAIFASDDENSDEEADVKMDGAEESTAHGVGPANSVAQPEEASNATQTRPPAISDHSATADLASFKPMFVPKSEREKRKNAKDKDGKEKKDRDKKKGKMVVSFEVDEGHGNQGTEKEKKRKEKRQKKQDARDAEEESMWVEKPPPDVVKDLVIPASTEAGNVESGRHPRGRKRAVDFL